MKKWIVSGAWSVESDPSFIRPIVPVVCDSEKEAMMEMADLIDYDLAGIDWRIVDSDWEWIFGLYDGDEHIADVGPDWVQVYEPLNATYQMLEMEI